MSYRELRDATEILRSLGYHRLVSIENFRFPNFPLMAEILEWTVKKFDPNMRIPKAIEIESDRIIFVKTCVLALIQKARVKLNPKNLYQSDGHAVRELLPVLRMLYDTFKQKEVNEIEEKAQISTLRTHINTKRQEIRRSMQLVSQIPHISANIYDLLAKEIFAKEVRRKALSQSINAKDVEREIREKIERTDRQIDEVQYKLSNISSDEQDLEKKIERRRREYDQLQKRLAKLQSFRPPYMDEYERYESQLKSLYTVYVVLFRNLAYLQQQLLEVERAEKERAENAERSMRIAVEKMRIENDILVGGMGNTLEQEPQTKEVKVIGNMIGADLSDEDDDTNDKGFEEGNLENEDDLSINEMMDDEDEEAPLQAQFDVENPHGQTTVEQHNKEEEENHSEDDF